LTFKQAFEIILNKRLKETGVLLSKYKKTELYDFLYFLKGLNQHA